MTLANKITLARIALIPFFIVFACIGGAAWDAIALVLFCLCSVTDFLDGYVARKYHQVTDFGKFVDPLADKLSLVTLIALFVADGQIPLWLMGIILLKEVAMVVGGAVALKRGIVVYALPIGKITTVAFITSIVVRFLGWRMTADVLLGVSVVLSMVALVWYSLDLMKKLKANDVDSTK